MSKRHVLVAGTPGSWLNVVAKHFDCEGWAVIWPGQDFHILDGWRYWEINAQNIEVQHIHEHFLSLNKLSPLADYQPLFYEMPYPGPAEFLAKFDQPAVVSGICIFPYVELWAGLIDVVIDIRATEEEDIAAFEQWAGKGVARKQLEHVRKHQLERYTDRLSSFTSVFTMTNAEAKDRRFDGLSRFVASVFDKEGLS